MTSLNKIDAHILQFICDNSTVSAEAVATRFPEISSINSRLRELEGCYFIESLCDVFQSEKLTIVNDSSVYRITDFGRKELENYALSTKQYQRELCLKNAWIPILVSFVTTVITTSLWPTVQRWLLSLLQQIM